LASKATTLSFERGNPSADSFPAAQIIECAEAVLRRDPVGVLQYGRPAGYMPLREIIADWHGATPEEVLISNGSLQILEFLSTLLVHPDATVFVEQPTYDRTIAILRRHGASLAGIPMKPDGPDVDFLTARLKATTPSLFYVIPDFQNPSGITASLAIRREILRLSEQHDFWIVEDAPYRQLRYKGRDVPTMKSLSPDRVLHMSSFTKLLSPGLRVGYVVAPAKIVEALGPIIANTYVCPGILAQGITYEFCRRGWLEPNIEALRDLYRPKLEATVAALRQHLPGADWVEPEGGYFVGLTLPEDTHTAGLRDRARAVGLGLSDGQGFFAQGGGDRFLRLAFPALSCQDIREGIARLASLLDSES
jgi:2-aminoadipate transaminase